MMHEENLRKEKEKQAIMKLQDKQIDIASLEQRIKNDELQDDQRVKEKLTQAMKNIE